MRRTPTVLALAAAGLLVAACGSTVDGTATAASGASSSASSGAATPTSPGGSGGDSSGAASPAPSGELSALLLGSGDFPAGYDVKPINASTLSQLADGLVGQLTASTVTPAECTQTNPYADLTSVVGVTGSDIKAGIVGLELLGPGDDSTLGALRAVVSGCGTFRASITAPDGSPVTLQGTVAEQQAPTVDADETLAVTTSATADLGAGTPVTTSQTELLARVGGTVVGVAFTSFGATPVGQALQDSTFAAAVAKVRAG